MKVFKFGGGVLKKENDLYRLAEILDSFKNEEIIIVISAFNKVTSKLEKLLNSYFFDNLFDSKLFTDIKSYHFNIIEKIFCKENSDKIIQKVTQYFDELESSFSKPLTSDYHYEYDKIVSYGELLSSSIIYHFLKIKGYNCCFEDIRKIILTDSSFSEAKIIWDKTISNANNKYKKENINFCITQGFIAADKDHNTTTLGKEGSDFTASILAYALDAEEVIFWKEVEGIYNADPAKTNDYILLPKLSYRESLEQAFYGAKILHPKTIKPLQNKKIPIFVKSFYNQSSGTKITDISKFSKDFYPEKPIFIIKENQILISISTLDYSFISEENLGKIFNLLSQFRIKVNLMQASAISFSVCVTNDHFKIPEFISELKKTFKVLYNENLQLITIRHYTDAAVKGMISGKEIILRQVSRKTARYLIK